MAQTQKRLLQSKKPFSIKKNIFNQRKKVFKCNFLGLKFFFAFKHFFSLIEKFLIEFLIELKKNLIENVFFDWIEHFFDWIIKTQMYLHTFPACACGPVRGGGAGRLDWWIRRHVDVTEQKNNQETRDVAIHLSHDTIRCTIFSPRFDTIRFDSIRPHMTHLHHFLKASLKGQCDFAYNLWVFHWLGLNSLNWNHESMNDTMMGLWLDRVYSFQMLDKMNQRCGEKICFGSRHSFLASSSQH